MKVVGLVSSYREGRLVQGAIRSLERVDLDDLLVYEGPAGEIPDGIEQAPASELPPSGRRALEDLEPGTRIRRVRGGRVHRGQWRSDARKRNAMLAEAKRRNGNGPLWGVWLDGDELLAHGEYLRDRLQAILWNDEADGTGRPTIHAPLWVVEADGSMAVTTGRLVRLDLIRSYDISVSVVTNSRGIEEGFGNRQTDARLWLEVWMRAVETGRMLAWPPGPLEPCIVHRSGLRHPARRGLRLHRQEADELRKAGKL